MQEVPVLDRGEAQVGGNFTPDTIYEKDLDGAGELRLTLATLGDEALERAEPQVQGTRSGVGPLLGQGVVQAGTGPHQ